MTVQTDTHLVRHEGDGSTTSAAIPFKFLAKEDLTVTHWDGAGTSTVWALGTDYTIDGTEPDDWASGGTLTATAAWAVGTAITIERETDDRQQSDYTEEDGFPEDTVESDFDRRAMIDQELRGRFARALTVPVGDNLPSAALEFPAAPVRRNLVAGFGDDGSAAVSALATLGLLDSLVSAALSAQAGLSGPPVVSTIADLRAINASIGQSVLVLGYHAAGDCGGGVFRADAADTTSSDDGGLTFVDAAGTRWKRHDVDGGPLHVRWWGAIGDNGSHPLSSYFASLEDAQAVYPNAEDLTDELDGIAIQAAFDYAQNTAGNLPVVRLGRGDFVSSRPLETYDGSHKGVAIVGEPFAPLRQGSIRGPCSIRYTRNTGDPAPILHMRGTYDQAHFIAFDNDGNASCAIKQGRSGNESAGGHNDLSNLAILQIHNPYTVANIWARPADYNNWTNLHIQGGGPVGILLDGTGLDYTGGTTRWSIERCFFGAIDNGDIYSQVKLVNFQAELLNIYNNAFIIGLANKSHVRVVDCEDIDVDSGPTDPRRHIDVFNFLFNEVEYNTYIADPPNPADPDQARAAGSIPFYLKNCWSFNFDYNQCMNDNGQVTSLAILINSLIRWGDGNFTRSWAGPLIKPQDAQSRWLYSSNELIQPNSIGGRSAANTQKNAPGGIVESGTIYTDPAITPVVTGTGPKSVWFTGQYTDPRACSLFRLTITDSVNYTMSVPVPGSTQYGHMVPGQLFAVEIENDSGGSLGTLSWPGGQFVMNGALTNPADGTSRFLIFRWDGTYATEIARSPVAGDPPAALKGELTYNAPSIADGASHSFTITVTGAALGDHVTVSVSADISGLTLSAYVSATDTVTVVLGNLTGGAVDLTSRVWRARVTKLAAY